MIQEKIILTDCDGVLLDWEGQFHEWMQSKGYDRKVDAVYDIAVTYGMEKAQAKNHVREFNESAWVGFLPAFRDARSGVARLVEAGYKFVCITSLSLDEKARLLRVSNLKNIFGKDVFLDVECLDTGADKDEALLPYQDSGLWWIEDKTENALTGAAIGLKSVLIAHSHNLDAADNADIDRVASWADIADLIISG